MVEGSNPEPSRAVPMHCLTRKKSEYANAAQSESLCEKFSLMIKGPDHAANVPLSVSQALRALNAKNVNVITNKLIQVNPGIEPSSK